MSLSDASAVITAEEVAMLTARTELEDEQAAPAASAQQAGPNSTAPVADAAIDDSNTHLTGRVFMGLGSGPTETTLNAIEGEATQSMWTPRTEAEYTQRVRDRAAEIAKNIIARGMGKARELKAQAREEGYAQAQAEGDQQVQAALSEYSDVLARAMSAVEEGSQALWQENREDIFLLIQAALEKILSVHLDMHRQDILRQLLDQALEKIDCQRNLFITVHPEDEQSVAELLTRAKSSHPDLERWGVRTQADMQPGGILIESDSGMVDNSIETRYGAVADIVEQLHLQFSGGPS